MLQKIALVSSLLVALTQVGNAYEKHGRFYLSDAGVCGPNTFNINCKTDISSICYRSGGTDAPKSGETIKAFQNGEPWKDFTIVACSAEVEGGSEPIDPIISVTPADGQELEIGN